MNEFDSAASAPASGIPYPLLRRLADAQAMREMDLRAMEHLRISGLMLMENAARSVVELLEREILRERPRVRIVLARHAVEDLRQHDQVRRRLIEMLLDDLPTLVHVRHRLKPAERWLQGQDAYEMRVGQVVASVLLAVHEWRQVA